MDITFLIPVRIDSSDRYINAVKSLRYLCHYCPYNIIILENDNSQNIPSVLESIDTNGAEIDYIFVDSSDQLFHKTKFLNSMLHKSKTKVVVNYDIDILLHPEAYEFCYSLIHDGSFDLIYPYAKGDYLINVFPDKVSKIELDLNVIDGSDFQLKACKHGLCQFLNREQYIKYGGMNENFVSYGPEDLELGYRFIEFGLKVQWINTYIVHLDHNRGINSRPDHFMAKNNYDLYEYIKTLDLRQLKEYYNV